MFNAITIISFLGLLSLELYETLREKMKRNNFIDDEEVSEMHASFAVMDLVFEIN